MHTAHERVYLYTDDKFNKGALCIAVNNKKPARSRSFVALFGDEILGLQGCDQCVVMWARQGTVSVYHIVSDCESI